MNNENQNIHFISMNRNAMFTKVTKLVILLFPLITDNVKKKVM